MAAVQRSCSSVEASGSSKNANFIDSMEEEVRRCAEHLERRQNWKSYRSTLGRKYNGFTPVGPQPSSSSFQSSGSDIGSRNVGYRSTLPRSFRSSATDQEGRSLLSPRVIPSGGKSPHESPDMSSVNHIFRFSNVLEEVHTGNYQQLHEDQHSPGDGGGGYPIGNSAPSDAFPCFSAGSGASSRDNSLTPLHSPQGRTPIGAVASHSHSRKSSRSSSSPPLVLPKPGKNSSRCSKSRTPPSLLCSHQVPHKNEVSSYHSRDPLELNSAVDPLELNSAVDPLLPTELAAAASSKNNSNELQFPSADIGLQNCNVIGIKAKSAIRVYSSGLHGSTVENSVDEEDFHETPSRVRSTSPVITSPTPAHSTSGNMPLTNSAAEARPSDVKSSSLDEAMCLHSPEMKQVALYPIIVKTEKQEKVSLKCVANTSSTPILAMDVCQDILLLFNADSIEQKQDVHVNQEKVNSKTSIAETTVNEVSDIDQLSGSVDRKDEEEPEALLEDQPPEENGISSAVVDELTEGEKEGETENGEDGNLKYPSESAQNEDKDILEEREDVEKTEWEFKPNTDLKRKVSEENTAFLVDLSTRASLESGAADKKGNIGDTSASSPVQQTSVAMATQTPGNGSPALSPSPSPSPPPIKQAMSRVMESFSQPCDQRAEINEAFLSETTSSQIEAVETANYEPEVKSISLWSRNAKGRPFRGRRGTPKIVRTSTQHEVRRASEPPETTPAPSVNGKSRPRGQSEPPRSATKLQPLVAELAVLEGASESVKAMVEELHREVREREEELVRVYCQREQENKEKEDCIKKLSREAKRVERDKWELLKRARDGAERSLHLRTLLDMKEGALHSIKGELTRTQDELVSVKSANTSLRALLAKLREAKACTDVAVQVDLIGGSMCRNHSMDLVYCKGLSQEQGDMLERTINYQSTNSLNWAEKMGYMDSINFTDDARDITPTPGQVVENSQSLRSQVPRKSRKKGTIFSKMMKSGGMKRGSKNHVGSTGKCVCVCV